MHTNPDIYGISDCWEKESSSLSLEQLLQEANALDLLTLPFVNLDDRSKLPSSKMGIYFAYCNKKVLYIGKTETSFSGRWQNHQTIPALLRYQKTRQHLVRIAYWHIPDKQLIGRIETLLIDIFQPDLNKVGTNKGARTVINEYHGTALVESVVLNAFKDELNNKVLEVSRGVVEGSAFSKAALVRVLKLENFLIVSGLTSCFAFCAIAPFFRLNLNFLASEVPQTQVQFHE